MSNDDFPGDASPQQTKTNRVAPKSSRSIFAVPPALKRIFDRFPLVVYDENSAPLRAPKRRSGNTLHVFATEDDARKGRPSYNPACLKWQTYLKIAGALFTPVSSSNHASPSGVLPFLLPPAAAKSTSTPDPVPSNRLKKWLALLETAETIDEPPAVRNDAFLSLVDNGIRNAWLFQLYLNPTNSSLVHRLYVKPCSTNPVVRLAISHQLRTAAEKELARTSNASTIVEGDIMQAANEAFTALSDLLDGDEWFFGLCKPSLFDASVFAYTHLILDSKMHWQDNKLEELLMEHGNLVQHRYRMLEMYY